MSILQQTPPMPTMVAEEFFATSARVAQHRARIATREAILARQGAAVADALARLSAARAHHIEEVALVAQAERVLSLVKII